MNDFSRRTFLQAAGAGALAAAISPAALAKALPGSQMKLGLVTYLWGQHWDLDTIIKNCAASGVLGVELRTEHAHGVQPEISQAARAEVKKKFADSPVICLGPGTNQKYDSPDPAVLRKNIEGTFEFIRLSHDIGASGVKVKPDHFQEGVPREVTIEQIGKSLNEVGKFAGDFGQEIRLEVHGSCAELPTIKAIMDVADNPNVGVCWNSNDQDLQGEGLEYNFNLVKDRFGATAHIRELNVGDYPYQELMNLFVAMDYKGWICLECRTEIEDGIAALTEQREIFESMVDVARAKLGA
ncbi:MAG: sugar phosphate isomerase/epimerase [Candidatus Hydrogenedentes bacterium]|nr:sugar phosphate isomerase/epimerase [Candidatus Hydrogenedentota bacterium]